MIALIAFSDLISRKTLDDWKKSIVDVATLVGFKVSNWTEGGFTRTLIALFATLYTTASDIVRLLAASSFLDTAEGEWLKILAKQVFNVDAIEATYASAANGLKLTNTGGGLFIFDAGDIVARNPTTQKTYRNTTGGTLSPGPGNFIHVDIVAEESGSGSTTGVGTITELVTAFLGVTCTNEVALTGLDEESPEQLRQRCRDSVATQSIGGIKNAYEFYAQSATRPDGTAIGITRVFVVPPAGDGTVTVYIATASGAVPSGDVAIVQQIFDENVTPYGLNATAVSAVNLSYTAPCTIWIPSALGLSAVQAQTIVDNALRAYVTTIPIGGVVIPPNPGQIFWRAVLGVIENSIKGMIKAQMTTEVDVAVATGRVPVWAGVPANVTVVQVT